MESHDAYTCERSHVGHDGDKIGEGLDGLPGGGEEIYCGCGCHFKTQMVCGPSRICTF